MADLSGTFLGRYKLTALLGKGGMAEVYRAHDASLGREVAVKVIRLGKEVEEEFLKRFEREAKALAKLLHPNIVPIHDYGEANGAPYLVMDYLAGGTLKDALNVMVDGQPAKVPPMPYQKAARLLAPIARALEYAHQQGIIHRDIKPANILLTKSGQPMLSDFGIAKMLEGEEATQLTSTGAGIGTPDYMAPEQWIGKVDGRADIYALGVVFYELITGQRPFKADTPAAVFLKHLNEPPPPPQQYIPGLPAAVAQVIARALEKKPEDRYQNMGEFASALESLAVSGQHTVLAAPSQNGIQARKAQAALAGVGLLVAGVLILCVLLAAGALILRPAFLFPAAKTLSPPAQPTAETSPAAVQSPQADTPAAVIPTPLAVSVDACAERMPPLPANNGDAETDRQDMSSGQGSINTRFTTSLALEDVSAYYKSALESGGWEWWSSNTRSDGSVDLSYVIKSMKCMVHIYISRGYGEGTEVNIGLNTVK